MNALTVPNGIAVALFGIALSAAFCDISWTKKNCIILVVGSAAILLMQALITYMDSWTAMQETYPLITHLPLAIILSVSGPPSRCWRHIRAVSSGAGRRFWWSR